MKPEQESLRYLGITLSKAKMYEYGVPERYHIKILQDPALLFALAIGLLGDLAARTNSEDIEESYLNELRENLQFSARFFDAYLQSRLKEELDPYLLLLGAASYYLCDFPGSSLVLAKRLGKDRPDLDCLGLEDLLHWLLQADLSTYFEGSEGKYGEYVAGISQGIIRFFENGSGQSNLFENASRLRKTAYDNGTPRQLLFADVICAIVKKRFENSTWYCLPQYSGLPTDQWLHTLQKDTFIRELWPAQHLLGKHGVFRGRSAIVQMPTSAGKTRATEIIIRSAFLANRASLAIIVTPFRALCHEIRNSFVEAFHNESVNVDELSDVLQADFEITELLGRKQVLVVTPEKLIYVLRHAPQLANNIGLLIYDEGHQFDSGTRGITYELLLTSLKAMVSREVQTVLISAVISNAESVGTWLNGEDSEVVSGTNLSPTYRTIAFTSWLGQLGRLEFVTQDNPDNREFFVPRIIEQHQLQLRGKERKQRLFPEKTDGQAIALFLGLKLVGNGSVAIFCGRKSTVSSLCEKIVDVYNRGISFTKPVEYSDQTEVKRLHFLYASNLGEEAIPTQSAILGMFTHHGNTPQGIRLAVEHAMKEGLIKFIVCTSTLAQGINLPIRYLIVTSIYQGAGRIRVRDFQNLIGRAGRAGMHTEGSLLFTDHAIYDKRNVHNDKWRWTQVKGLLDLSNLEPCASTLLSLFEPLYSDNRRYKISMEPLEFVKAYIDGIDETKSYYSKIASDNLDKGFTIDGIEKQIAWRMHIISSIESYLMSHWDETGVGLQEGDINELAKGTLAFFLADDDQRGEIVELFNLLVQNIEQKVSEVSRRKIFGKTLYGVRTSIEIEEWVTEHVDDLIACPDHEEIIVASWPIIEKNIQNKTFKKCDSPEILRDVALEWIRGKPFHELFAILSNTNARIIAKTQRRWFKLDHIIDICENAFAYDGTLVLGAIAEFIKLIRPENTGDLISKLQKLQKRLKYGLPSTSAITLYELGFADRVIAVDISLIFEGDSPNKYAIIRGIKEHEHNIRKILDKYPKYFQMILDDVLS